MSINKPVQMKKKKIETDSNTITVHASLIPIFLCEIDNYLLTLKGNHHPISISNNKFISGTRDIGTPKEISEHKRDNSMTVFPFFERLLSSQEIQMKLPLQPLLPLRHYDIERLDVLDLLPENSDQLALPDTKRHGYTLNKEHFNQSMIFLEKLVEHSAVDGKSAFDFITFMFKDFGDDLNGKLTLELQDGTKEINIAKEEEFITDYNKQPARHYQAIRKFIQVNTPLRFAMIDGQHRSFGLYLRLLNRNTSDESVEMHWDEEATGKTNFKNKNIDSRMQV